MTGSTSALKGKVRQQFPECVRVGVCQTYVAEFEAFKAEKTRQLVELEGHAFYLFDYCNLLATIIANFEKVPPQPLLAQTPHALGIAYHTRQLREKA